MKKTILSLAIMLTISLGSEATNSNQSLTTNLVKKTSTTITSISNLEDLEKIQLTTSEEKQTTEIECFILSCRTSCMEVEEQLSPEESVETWLFLEEFWCE